MTAITISSLMTLRSYAQHRRAYKQRMIRHRRARCVGLGPWLRLQFEDELTIRYQIQEVLHINRSATPQAMQEQIDTYAHLLPDGRSWKATLQIELPDAHERERELARLNEAAHRVFVAAPQQPRVYASANDDLPDRHLARPSAVHFLRFELPAALRDALLAGAPALLGCAHEGYEFRRLIPPATLDQLRRDLEPAPPAEAGAPLSAALTGTA